VLKDLFVHRFVKADRTILHIRRLNGLAEAVFMQQATFPVAAVRFPIVLGTDDYTKRLHFHIEHVREGKEIGIPNSAALISFIRSDEAADFLLWLAHSHLTSPVNACSDGTVRIGDIISTIEQATGKRAVVKEKTADEHSCKSKKKDPKLRVPATFIIQKGVMSVLYPSCVKVVLQLCFIFVTKYSFSFLHIIPLGNRKHQYIGHLS
jgi:hypothetical protein